MNTRTEKLRQLMAANRLTCRQVGELLGRKELTVRIWRCKNAGRIIPQHELELLELKLKAAA